MMQAEGGDAWAGEGVRYLLPAGGKNSLPRSRGRAGVGALSRCGAGHSVLAICPLPTSPRFAGGGAENTGGEGE